MTGLLNNFSQATARSGAVIDFVDEGGTCFVWNTGSPGLIESLQGAVSNIRQYLAERSLDDGVKSARDGIEAVLDFLATGAKFTTARDVFGLDAGYYIAKYCTNYDFAALDAVERIGAVKHVEWVRYYNNHPYAREAFLAACAAGLVFSGAKDESSRTAGFWVCQSSDPEIIAAYEAAGGTFTTAEQAILGRHSTTRVA